MYGRLPGDRYLRIGGRLPGRLPAEGDFHVLAGDSSRLCRLAVCGGRLLRSSGCSSGVRSPRMRSLTSASTFRRPVSLRLRQHLLLGLRDRRDHARAGPGRSGGAHPDGADHDRHRGRPGDRRHQLPQTIAAYPSGGGSYIVASENLGLPGLAAGALLTDYILTVAVSIAAGVAALTSIFPELFEYRVAIGVGFVLLPPRQPARHPRERDDLHGPDLRLPGRDLRPARVRLGPLRDGDARYTAPPAWPEAHAEALGCC